MAPDWEAEAVRVDAADPDAELEGAAVADAPADGDTEAEAAPDLVGDVVPLATMLADADKEADPLFMGVLLCVRSGETDTLAVAVEINDALNFELKLGLGVHVSIAASPVPRQHGHVVGHDELTGQKNVFGQRIGSDVAPGQ